MQCNFRDLIVFVGRFPFGCDKVSAEETERGEGQSNSIDEISSPFGSAPEPAGVIIR